MGLAERADVIVDFTNVPIGRHVLANVGPDEPFGGGVPGDDFEVADPGTTGQVMEFRVVPAVAADPTTPPRFLGLPGDHPAAGGGPHAAARAHREGRDRRGPRRRGGRGPDRGGPRHDRSRLAGRAPVDGSRDREPRRRRHRDLGALQHDRGRAPDACPRGDVRGRGPGGSGHGRGGRRPGAAAHGRTAA